MGSDSNGAQSGVPAAERLNVYALVIYIPDPLGRFLDDLRRELALGCNPHAHVSVLPPRPLAGDWQVAGAQVRGLTERRLPFDVGPAALPNFPAPHLFTP